MYEYHGWATIRESSSYEEDEDKYLLAVNEIQKYFNELNWSSGVLDIRAVNGDFHVWIAGLDNHKPVPEHNPIEVLKNVGELAPGSYGVLYVRDSDDPVGGQEHGPVESRYLAAFYVIGTSSCPEPKTRTCTDCRKGQEPSPITDKISIKQYLLI
ncbi:Imm7 family immunity protein [Paenibacillus faecalis]|uniref:Imm7 family immunity protein n=1 Tax=Paenibacillus faecalis TaxID=2079532 RepID=UPI000D0FC574|nr:Imm7 family immunity protein [Paenibacillus faecalis]